MWNYTGYVVVVGAEVQGWIHKRIFSPLVGKRMFWVREQFKIVDGELMEFRKDGGR